MILDRLFEKRASLENPSTSLSDPANWLFGAFGAQPTTSDVVVTERNATQITAFWSAVGTISDTLAELPIKLVQTMRNGSTKQIKSHPALSLLQISPNHMMSAIVHKSTSQMHTLTWGAGYSWIRRNQLNEPMELWPLMPNSTKPFVRDGQLKFSAKLDIGQTEINASDVLHIPALSRNGIAGMSIIAEQREMLGAIIATQRFGSRFFANGAKAGGLIAYPNKVRDPEKVKAAIERSIGGENQNSLLVLSDGADYKQFTIPPEDAQFLQTREFGVDEIGRMFRLPLHFLNKMGQATFNNLEQMGTHFAQYTMMPWIVRWEQELSRKLLTPEEIRRGFRFKFNLGALMRGDMKTRYEVYGKGIQWSILAPNEARAFEELNPRAGGDNLLRPKNMDALDEEGNVIPAPAQNAANSSESEPSDDDDDDDDDGNDDSDDDSSDQDDRAWLILTAAAQRLANRESKGVSKILSRDLGVVELADELDEYYRGHETFLVENLAMSADDARQYCRTHAEQLFDAGSDEAIDELLVRWTTTDVLTMVNKLSEELG